jgi:CysZ protein
VSTPHVAAEAPASTRRSGFVRDFVTGVSFLLRGLGTYARNPGLMLLGLVPALITFVLLALGFVGMFRFWAADLADLITPFADGWSAGPRDAVRVLATAAILLVWVVLSLLLFTALTLTVGQPFYEAISKRVEDRLGGVPGEINVSFWKTLPRSIIDSLRLFIAMFVAVFVFLVG